MSENNLKEPPIPKYKIGDVVFVKNMPAMSVTRGVIDKISSEVWATNHKGDATAHMIMYRLMIIDRPSGEFNQAEAPELHCYPDWESAWWEKKE